MVQLLLNMSLIIVEFLEDVANVDKSRSPKVEHLPSLVKILKWPLKVLFPGKVYRGELFKLLW